MEPIMSATTAFRWLARRGYGEFTRIRLERVLDRAHEEGVSVEDLTRQEHRFALFVTMVRALERCSNNEMADYLADLMIGGIKSDMIDRNTDYFQILMSALGGMTRTEVGLLVLMKELQMYEGIHAEKVVQPLVKQFEEECEAAFELEAKSLDAVLNGMIRTGFITPKPSVIGHFHNTNTLTPLAGDLFFLIDHRSRITQ